jgi:hypothetical protein
MCVLTFLSGQHAADRGEHRPAEGHLRGVAAWAGNVENEDSDHGVYDQPELSDGVALSGTDPLDQHKHAEVSNTPERSRAEQDGVRLPAAEPHRRVRRDNRQYHCACHHARRQWHVRQPWRQAGRLSGDEVTPPKHPGGEGREHRRPQCGRAGIRVPAAAGKDDDE